MDVPSPSLDPVAALRRQLGGKLRSGADYLREWEGRDSRVREEGPRADHGLDRLVAGLRRGAFTEILVPGPSQGGGLFLGALLSRARAEGAYTVLLDVGSGFQVEGFAERDLEPLLWIGCDTLGEALAVFDVVARDGNFRRIVLDGRDGPVEDWRAVRPALWQRLGQALRERGTTAAILSRVPVAVAKDRYRLSARLVLDHLHGDRAALMEAVEVRRVEALSAAAGGRAETGAKIGSQSGAGMAGWKAGGRERGWSAGKIA